MTHDKDNIMTRWPLPTHEMLKVAVDLLREVVGPLEVSAAIIEDEDGGATSEALIASVKRCVEQFDSLALSEASLSPQLQAQIRSEPVEVDLSAPMHATLYVLHPDGSVSPAAVRSSSTTAAALLNDDDIRAIAVEHFAYEEKAHPLSWGPDSLNEIWLQEIGIPFARAVQAHLGAAAAADEVDALDKRRLDWLEANCTGASDSERYLPRRLYWGTRGHASSKSIRAVIDAAIAAQEKK
jgi:hypothetical protein